MEYIIVPMDRSHIGQIAQLERECFSQPWSEGALEEELYNPQASFIVAEDGEGGVLGYAGLHVILDEGYITNVAVEEAARRHGVASALMVLNWYQGQKQKEKAAEAVWLPVIWISGICIPSRRSLRPCRKPLWKKRHRKILLRMESMWR